jgi:hypothetical protein
MQYDVLDERVLLSVTADPLADLPMQPLTISSSFVIGKPIDAWTVPVNAGNDLAVAVQETNGSTDPLKIAILGPLGKVVAQTGFSESPNLYVPITATGTYTVQVTDTTPSTKERDSVKIEVFGIDKGTALPSAEKETGKRSAWLDGNVLSVVEPSGEGFQITSNWTKSVTTDLTNGEQFATYTTAGPSTIKLSGSTNNPAEQNIGITIDGSITVQTDPGVWGSHVGTIASLVFGSGQSPLVGTSGSGGATAFSVHSAAAPSGLPTTVDANALFNQFNTQYGLGITVPTTGFGMATGSTLMGQSSFAGVPLRPDGTYFYYQSGTAGSISFGNASVSAGGANAVTVIIDPSDPFIYASGGGGTIAFGASAKGLIPFTPASSAYKGPTFSGQFYGAVNGLPLGDLPATVSGNAVINIDPNQNGSGTLSTLGTTASGLFGRDFLKGKISSGGVDIGVNGSVAASTDFAKIANFSVTVANATLGFVAGGTDPVLKLKAQLPAGGVNFGAIIGTVSYADLRSLLPATLAPSTASVAVTKYSFGIFPVTRYVPVSALYEASTVPRPYSVALAGNSENDPFVGTALAGVFNLNGPSFTASFSSTGTTFAQLAQKMQIDVHGSANWAGYNFGTLDFMGNSTQASFNAPVHFFVGTAQVAGDVNFQTGAFTASATFSGTSTSGNQLLPGPLSGSTSRSLTVGIKNVPSGANNTPHISLYANLHLGGTYTATLTIPHIHTYTAKLSGSFDAAINIDPSNSTYSGSVTASASASAGDISISGSISGTVSTSGIGVKIGYKGISHTFIIQAF